MRGSRRKRRRLIRRAVLRTVAAYEIVGAATFFVLLLTQVFTGSVIITSHSLFWINPLAQIVGCAAGVLLWRFHRMGLRLSVVVQLLQLLQLKTSLAILGLKPALAYWLSASLESANLDARYSDNVFRINLVAAAALGVLIWHAVRYPGLIDRDGNSAI